MGRKGVFDEKVKKGPGKKARKQADPPKQVDHPDHLAPNFVSKRAKKRVKKQELEAKLKQEKKQKQKQKQQESEDEEEEESDSEEGGEEAQEMPGTRQINSRSNIIISWKKSTFWPEFFLWENLALFCTSSKHGC